jgi:hypothetical protein
MQILKSKKISRTHNTVIPARVPESPKMKLNSHIGDTCLRRYDNIGIAFIIR